MTSLPTLTPGPRILANPIRDRVHIHHDRNADYDCVVFIRCNGSEFHIELSPSFLSNSPLITARYHKFTAKIRGRSGDIDAENEAVAEHKEEKEEYGPADIKASLYDWLIITFEPVFSKVAADLPSSFDPDKTRTGEARPVLSEYLFPDIHRCRLEAEDDKPFPIYMPDEETQFREPLCSIDADLSKKLKQHVNSFDPSALEVSFRRSKHAGWKRLIMEGNSTRKPT
jgi:hypothetical protein